MPQQQRGTATDRLADVIQVLQLGRKSGLLTVERGEGRTFEEGSIIFVAGQVTQAQVAQHTGREALNLLSTWGHCHFAFVPAAASEATHPLKSIRPGTQAYMIRDTDPTLRMPAVGARRDTQLLAQKNGSEREAGWPNGMAAAAPYRTRQLDNALQMIERTGLSRAHRHLLLLIDGYRPLTELIRLMGRGQDEVSKLLQDLERAGLIRQ